MTRTQLKRLTPKEAVELYKLGEITPLEYALYCLERRMLSWPEISGDGLRTLRKKYGMPQKDLATLLGVAQQTIMRWEAQPETIPAPVRMILHQMDESMEGYLKQLELVPGHPEYPREFRKKFNAELKAREQEAGIVGLELSGDDEQKISRTRKDLIELRHRLSMSRGEFAKFLNVSASSIDKWENGTSRPLGITEIFLKLLFRNDTTSRNIIRVLKKTNEAKAQTNESPDPEDRLID
ncbi:MAG: helix-turn-helix domain-containing protein [Sutterellaceae bacterium]|nr:helix-turn-helix domain-containing protein [Sutterellaceae bacterium]